MRIGHRQQGLVGGNTYILRPSDGFVNHALVALGVNKPDPAIRRVGKIDLIACRDCEVMGLHALHNYGFVPIGSERDDPLAVMLAGVESTVRAGYDSVRSA